ncbi:hypothetical protein NDR87_23040 [Nocardia sp. CDC159]|uniref:Secreted protein n=1 Tax=Nocardia pulmonis TaxID=2951408 RepID=A0A9X2IY18_9NOCA|nr:MULTISPECIES: hypothetical protein [Nocardia]MCM6776602.1 hypothetical protein [Nocardia pulmonis]MCM6789249.1 hypothetical protein [Nocardia sp. CDC159]
MTNRKRRTAAAFGVAAVGAATVVIGSGPAHAAAPQGCVENRQLTAATVTCPGLPPDWGAEVDVDCVGVFLTYGLAPGVGRYTQLGFGSASRGVTVACIGGDPNRGLGIVTDVRVRIVPSERVG